MQPTSVHFVLIFISVKVWILRLFDGKVQSVNIYFVFSESVFTIFIKVEGFPMLFCLQQLDCLGLSRTFKFKAFYLCSFLCICLFVYLCILFSRCCLVRNVTVVINLKRLPPPTSQHYWCWNIFSFLFVKILKCTVAPFWLNTPFNYLLTIISAQVGGLLGLVIGSVVIQ